MNKLLRKLHGLVEEAEVKFINGHQIKRCFTGDWQMKPFQVDKIKYKLGLEVERKCSNVNFFVPSEPIVRLINYREGRVYESIPQISKFLGFTEDETTYLYESLVTKTIYTSDDIVITQQEYFDFLKTFKEQFLL